MGTPDFTRTPSRILTPWLAGALVLVLAAAQASGVLRVRVIFLSSAIALAVFAWPAVCRSISRPERNIAVGLFAASVLLQALPEIVRPSAISFYEFVWRTSLVMLGWGFALSLLNTPARSTPGLSYWGHNRAFLALLLALTFIGLVGTHFAIRDRYAVVGDEVVYLLQGKLLLTSGYTREIDSSLVPFCVTRESYVLRGRMNGQYPPGWPLLLAVFGKLGLRWFAPICMGLLAVSFTYLLGKQLRSRTVGLLAASLLASNYWFIYLGSTYFAHASTMALCLAGAWLLVRAEGKCPHVRLLLWAPAGFVLGMATAIRPLTGAALALSLWSWMLVRRRVRGLDIIRMTVAVGLGAAAPLGFLLHYNNTVNGAPFLFGYQVVNAGLPTLGFGRRGTMNFTPGLAVFHFLSVTRDISLEFTPAFILAPLFFLGLHYKLRFSWTRVAVFLVLPAAQFFYYYYSGSRFHVELLPFLLVGTAVLLTDMSLKDSQVARYALGFLLAGNLFFGGLRLCRDYKAFREGFFPYFTGIVDLQRQKGNLLVFVRDWQDSEGFEVLFDALSWFNVDSFSGSVIVARDLGPQNATLMERWRDHFPVWVCNEGIGEKPQRPTFVPLVNPSNASPPRAAECGT